MNIVVMNCNTTASMTEAMASTARSVAAPGTVIIGMQPNWGPDSAEGYFDSYLTAAAVLDRMTQLPDDVDAVVMAGFGEHGREGARELLTVPVVDVTEAGAHLALMLGHRYGVVTTLRRAIAQISDSLTTANLLGGCAAIDAADLGVLEIEEDVEATRKAMLVAAHRVIERGAEVIVLGCAGMVGLREYLEEELPVPVIDSIEAATKLAESLVGLGLSTSKYLTYAAPRTKKRPGWPISPSQ
ncbi:aspartate/glutamate racemase family protein [Microbacterium trichothecenolyticum]|uniref:Allantoin racemase n=1 Tax=Microbacterium trichothecenolyticum TaxID=69370 RepID=A0ABU0TZ29_MICTR|nr:aspartate/glutamate racemase family protein [Microbacterium trichothecenolyticum]MDQ1124770.1 allantoin racemase [Microbacterium trichothecenolyticum]